MPAGKPPEFGPWALDLVAIGEPVAQVAEGLGISERTLRRWMAQYDVNSGGAEGLTSAKKRELV